MQDSSEAIFADQRQHPRSLQPICPRNACQGTSPPSRRQLTLLQGPSRGEEASKKLLATGSAEKAKPRRPQGSRTKACLDQGTARAHKQRSVQHSCCLPLTCLTGLTSIVRGSAVAAARASPPAPAKLLSRCAGNQGAQAPLPAAPRFKAVAPAADSSTGEHSQGPLSPQRHLIRHLPAELPSTRRCAHTRAAQSRPQHLRSSQHCRCSIGRHLRL